MAIINLTQHAPTVEQIREGVVSFDGEALEALKKALTFDDLPQKLEITRRAVAIAEMAADAGFGPGDGAMIGGAPYLMSALEQALTEREIRPLYSFSVRESIEQTLPDGCVKKTHIFRHLGFVWL